jgi:hypothetical protein
VTSNALQHTSGGGADGFLTHMDNRGRLLFSTYIGGSGNDQITAIDTLTAIESSSSVTRLLSRKNSADQVTVMTMASLPSSTAGRMP